MEKISRKKRVTQVLSKDSIWSFIVCSREIFVCSAKRIRREGERGRERERERDIKKRGRVREKGEREGKKENERVREEERERERERGREGEREGLRTRKSEVEERGKE